ncbi:MAG: peptidylprolyl isomerase [Neisseriaceae bacterium]|jgi:peptidyl-prolyl cis-trans isomerase C|nr:Peptidylprolyl isomerase [Pseudomonadota bacterium]RTK97196.1 MAG: peptidylprolyl isomerase [Neisseriaceae bacterium]
MNKISRLLAVLVTASVAMAAQAQNIAVVNGVAIPQAKMDIQLKALAARGQKDSPELRNAIKDSLVTAVLIEQEATKKGLDKTPDVQAELEMARQSVIFRAYVQDYMKNNPVTDAEIKAEYDKYKATQADREYNVRHILVKDEKAAKDIIEQLKKGAKFDKLAEKFSIDPGSKAKGGELGWNAPGNFVKPFAEAMTKLDKGQISKEPVKSDFGFHVIKLDDVRSAKVPGFDEVKPQITEFLQRKKLETLMAGLRAKAKIE